MKDPLQIGGCGHRLCKICSEGLLRQPIPKCPVDRQPLLRTKIFSDIACHRTILNLTLKCSYDGCPWTGQLRALEKHQSECRFKVVECPNAGCKERFTKHDMINHKAFECSWRKVNCEYCQESVIFKNKQQHFGDCQKFPVQCTNTCGLRDIPRDKLAVHIRDDCPLTEVHCEYKNLGCEEVFPRTRAKSHSESQVERHLNLVLRSLEATQCQVKDQSRQIQQLMVKDQNQAQQIKELTTKAKSQLEDVQALKVKVNAQAQQMKKLEKQEYKNLSEESIPELEREPRWNKLWDRPLRHAAVGNKEETGKTFKPQSTRDIKLGMKIEVNMAGGRRGRGIVKYVGRGAWLGVKIGVELDPGLVGTSDGSLFRMRFFNCAPNRGIFVRLDDVVRCNT